MHVILAFLIVKWKRQHPLIFEQFCLRTLDYSFFIIAQKSLTQSGPAIWYTMHRFTQKSRWVVFWLLSEILTAFLGKIIQIFIFLPNNDLQKFTMNPFGVSTGWLQPKKENKNLIQLSKNHEVKRNPKRKSQNLWSIITLSNLIWFW